MLPGSAGIGTPSPGARLHVIAPQNNNNTYPFTPDFIVDSSGASSQSIISLRNNGVQTSYVQSDSLGDLGLGSVGTGATYLVNSGNVIATAWPSGASFSV